MIDEWDVVPTGGTGGACASQSDSDTHDITAEDASGLSKQEASNEEPKLTTPNQSEGRSAFATAVDEQERSDHLKTTARMLRLEADLDASPAQKASSSEHSEPELLFDDAEEGAQGPEMDSEHAQEVWQRTGAYMADIQQAFKQKPAVRIQGAERHMKLLLVGEPGLGKPLFIKNMFAPYCHDTDLPVSCAADDTSAETFAANPDNYCTKIAVDVDENRTRIHYRAQDTPGVHLPGAPAAILDHVLSQSRKFMAAEEDPKRVVPMSALVDPRVDICIYFMPPHFLKPQDIELITQLSELVPVVPIIAKADSLTTVELEQYRRHVRAELNKASAVAGRPVMHNFSAEDLAAAGASRDVPPFAVITSNDVDLAVGRYWPVRVFPWGKCETMTSNHSDLPLLKRLLFEVGFEGLKAATENRFYTLRESCLTSRVLSRALSSGVLPPTAPTTPDAAADTGTADARTLSPRQKPPPPPSPPSHGKPACWFGTWAVAGLVAAIVLLEMAAVGYYATRSAHLESVVARQQSDAATESQVIRGMQAELLAQHADHQGRARASRNSAHLNALGEQRLSCSRPAAKHATQVSSAPEPEEDSIWPHHDLTLTSKLADSFKAKLARIQAHTTALPSTVAESYRSLARSFTATTSAATRELHRKAIALAEQQSRTLRSASAKARASIARLASQAGSAASKSVSNAAAVLGSSVRQAAKGRKAAVLWGRAQLFAALEGSARAAVHASASSKAAAWGVGAAGSAAATKVKAAATQFSAKGVAGAKILASHIGSQAQTLSATMQGQGQILAARFRGQAQVLLDRSGSRAQELGKALKARLAASQRAARASLRFGWRSTARSAQEGIKWLQMRQGLRPELRALGSWFQGAQRPATELASRIPQRALRIAKKALHLGTFL